jgi:hypothetical protein
MTSSPWLWEPALEEESGDEECTERTLLRSDESKIGRDMRCNLSPVSPPSSLPVAVQISEKAAK